MAWENNTPEKQLIPENLDTTKVLTPWEALSAKIKSKYDVSGPQDFEKVDQVISLVDAIGDPGEKAEMVENLLSFIPADKDELLEFYSLLLPKIQWDKYYIFSADIKSNIADIIGRAKSRAKNNAEQKKKQQVVAQSQATIEDLSKVEAAKLAGQKALDAEKADKLADNINKDKLIDATVKDSAVAYKDIRTSFDKSISSVRSFKSKVRWEGAKWQEEFDKFKRSEQQSWLKTLDILRRALTASNPKKTITDEDIFDFVRYQSRLNAKAKDGKLTLQSEIAQAKQFQSFLQAANIQDNFFTSIDRAPIVQKMESANYGSVQTKETTQWLVKPTTSAPSLANLSSASYSDMKSSGMTTTEVFKGNSEFKDDELLKTFPLPKGFTAADFMIEGDVKAESNRLKIERINQFIEYWEHPLIDTTNPDEKSRLNERKSLVTYLLYKNNPLLSDNNMSLSELRKWREAWLIVAPMRAREETVKLAESNLTNTMKNNFCGPDTETLIAQETKQGYVSYISNFLSKTPGLSDFKINPKDITLTNNYVEIPLRLTDDKWSQEKLTIENCIIYLTSAMRNENDPNSNNQIKPGRVRVGEMDKHLIFR